MSTPGRHYNVGGVLLPRPFKIRRLGHFGFNAVNLAERGFPAGTVALEAGSSWEGAVRISAAG